MRVDKVKNASKDRVTNQTSCGLNGAHALALSTGIPHKMGAGSTSHNVTPAPNATSPQPTKPMRVKTPDEDLLRKILKDPDYIWERKLKGVRASILFGLAGNVITSRGGMDYSGVLPQLAEVKVIDALTGTEIDGELHHNELDDYELAAMLKGGIPEDIAAGIRFAAFDVVQAPCYYIEGKIYNHPLRFRKAHLKIIMQAIPATMPIELMPYESVTVASVRRIYNSVVAAGGEGLVLKNLNSTYTPGACPRDTWYKMKKTETYDVIIMGYKTGTGRNEGLVTSIVCGLMDASGKLKRVGNCAVYDTEMKSTFATRGWDYLNKVIEISCDEINRKGKMRTAHYICLRDDKAPSECTMPQVKNGR